ncbi:MAG: alkaline phosphatase [Planctomycetia bacterium]
MKKHGFVFLLVMGLLVSLFQEANAQPAKNVILMISDGCGFNCWEASRYFEAGLPYDDAGFQFYGMTTYCMDVEDQYGNPIDPTGVDSAGQNWVGVEQGYDQTQAWSDLNYLRNIYTDSAAAGTAMYTGVKTYKGACSYGLEGNDLKTIAEYLAETGRATGVVTSVPISHATPAGVDAHNYDRNDFSGIANEMIYNSDLDVIMGVGDPTVSGEYKYVGGTSTWADITDANGANGFTFVNTVTDFKALANGTYPGGTPGKVLGVAHATSTLNEQYKPSPNNETVVPRLETMSKGALNVLSQDADGFFLMIEGGAVDKENHNNNATAMLYEQYDFNRTAEYVIDWIEANGGWDENLLIITADHECGGIWGPNTVLDDNGTPRDFSDDTIAETWTKVVDNGYGQMPGFQYTSYTHTNTLVPMWAKGVGANKFSGMVDGNDSEADDFWSESQGWDWNGDYIDNTDIFTAMLRSTYVLGDANHDGQVDSSDATILAGNWQAGPSATWEMGDFNGDGMVDSSDATILAGNWQYGTGSSSVPEPSTLFMLVMGLLGWGIISLRKQR